MTISDLPAMQGVPPELLGQLNLRLRTLSQSISQSSSNVGTAGTYTKVTTDAQGRVTSGASLQVADIPVGAKPVSSQSVVTSARAIGTVYQNTGSKPMFVSATITVTAGTIAAYTDTAATPTTGVASNANGTGSAYALSLAFWVLPGNYYKVTGGSSVSTWVEWT